MPSAQALAGALLLSSLIATTFGHARNTQTLEVVERDICIIGGGSSGTYSAIRLQELGKTVAVVEKENRLGGHVNTYRDPTTNESFDYGVIVFDNITVVKDYFAHFNISLVSASFLSGGTTVYANFANGSQVSASLPNYGNSTAAFLTYSAQLEKYPYLVNGFNLPSPVPDDLLLTWGEFINKYDLGALAYTIFTYNQGVGNILDLPTLYIFKYLNAGELQSFATGFLTTAQHDNQELYDRALAELGTSAFINANVTKISRNDGCIDVFVSTTSGPKLIRASKLLLSIPPKLENLSFLDLDSEETNVFRQFNNSYYWDAVIKNSGIPENISLSNVDPTAPWDLPPMPAIYGIASTPIAGLVEAYYSSPYAVSDEEVKDEMLATIARLVTSLGYSPVNGTPEFVGFNSHAPFELQVSAEAIKNGFYGRLEALQGRHNTWWTGAAWQSQDSSVIWNFTEHAVLPQLLG